MVFHHNIALQHNIWLEMRKFLAKRQVTLVVHERRRAVYRLTKSLFTDENEKQTAPEMAHDILSKGNTRTHQFTEHGQALLSQQNKYQYGSYATKKVAHNIPMRLKNSAQELNGRPGQCCQNFVYVYKHIAKNYGLNEHEKLSYVHSLVSKHAHREYIERVRPHLTPYSDAIEEIERDYNSAVQQTRVKNHLSNSHISSYVTTDVNTDADLEILYKRILTMSRQVPPSHRGHAHKIEFLRSAVTDNKWAIKRLSRIATSNLSFQELYAELEIAVQLNRESKAGAA